MIQMLCIATGGVTGSSVRYRLPLFIVQMQSLSTFQNILS